MHVDHVLSPWCISYESWYMESESYSQKTACMWIEILQLILQPAILGPINVENAYGIGPIVKGLLTWPGLPINYLCMYILILYMLEA